MKLEPSELLRFLVFVPIENFPRVGYYIFFTSLSKCDIYCYVVMWYAKRGAGGLEISAVSPSISPLRSIETFDNQSCSFLFSSQSDTDIQKVREGAFVSCCRTPLSSESLSLSQKSPVASRCSRNPRFFPGTTFRSRFGFDSGKKKINLLICWGIFTLRGWDTSSWRFLPSRRPAINYILTNPIGARLCASAWQASQTAGLATEARVSVFLV